MAAGIVNDLFGGKFGDAHYPAISAPIGAARPLQEAGTECYIEELTEEGMRLITLHDILVAWQAGDIGYRRAMQLAQIDTLDELYEAAHNSGVQINTKLTSDEEAMANVVADLIRGQAHLRAA